MQDDPRAATGAAPTKTLMRGLEILQVLVEADAPISATEVALRVGVHQSSASRILATLADAGYVRKAGYRSFEPDYGVLGIGASASSRFALARKPRTAMLRASERCEGFDVTLCVLWRGQTIYFLRTHKGIEPILFSGTGFPLHLSAPGLRFLVEMPDAEALELLRASRNRYGWARSTDKVPETEEEVLARARSSFEHDCVVLDGWVERNHLSAAISVRTDEPHPVALALTGSAPEASPDRVRLWLHDFRRDVEAQLAADVPASVQPTQARRDQ